MLRRTFMKDAALTLAAASAMTRAALGAKAQPFGLQLYTVMSALERDFEGTLASVAQIGYREVETIGAFGRDPAHVRELLDKHGLVSPSQHMVPGDLYTVFEKLTRRELTFEDAGRHWREVMSLDRVGPIMEECIAQAKVLGQKYIVWQVLWPEQMQTRALINGFCKALNTAGELCSREGLVLNYHNHDAEFSLHDGVIPYDVILENTDAKFVKFELDTYWATKAGADPLVYFNKYPGRYRQCHLKDGTVNGEITTIGHGIMKFPVLLAAARKAGIEHYYVEQDGAADPMKAIRQAYTYLRAIS